MYDDLGEKNVAAVALRNPRFATSNMHYIEPNGVRRPSGTFERWRDAR